MASDTPAITRERPPGPDGLPILGNQLAYLRDPFGFMTRVAREYGDVASWDDPGGLVYQLNHPEHIEHVLVQHNERYVKGEGFQHVLGPITGNGILNSEGVVWRRNRHLIQPAFHPDRIREYAAMMTDRTEAHLERWADGEIRPIHEELMELTLDIVSRALFGADIGEDIETVGRSLETFMLASESLAHFVLPEEIPTPGRRRIRRARVDLHEVVDRLIDERRSDPTDRDVISRLLEETDEAGNRMSRAQIRDEVVTLLLAGHETTALALTFTAHLLSRAPAVEERLVEELENLDGESPTMADLEALTYTEKVVKESMRLYPPVPGIVREAVKPDAVGDYVIPAGATVRMHQWVVHRDPRWYDDPLAFRPERWTEEMGADLPKLAYFPFAAGPRRCIGDRFAMLEARLLLATIYQRFHLEAVPGTDLDLMATVTARPRNEIPMVVHRR